VSRLDAVTAWWRDLIALPSRTAEIHHNTQEMLHMADQITQTLTDVAAGLRGPLATSITALIAERDAAVARATELGATELAQGTAAEDVRAAFADVAGLFAPVAEVPDVEPLPETPAEPEPAPGESADGQEPPAQS
jgi:hypothetical protein